MYSHFKRCTSMLLAVVMLFSLIGTTAWADDSEESTQAAAQENTETVSSEDPNRVIARFEVPLDEISSITEDEWADILQDAGMTEDEADSEPITFVRVRFTDLPDGAVVRLFRGIVEVMPETDGSFLVTPGGYRYSVSCEGFVPVEETELLVPDDPDRPIEVSVTMAPAAIELDASEEPEETEILIEPEEEESGILVESEEEPGILVEPEEITHRPTWEEFLAECGIDTGELSKEDYCDLRDEYALFCFAWDSEHGIETADGAASYGTFYNDYLSVAVAEDGRFTIGTREGNPNYSSDNNVKLLYGHPDPGTSETLIVIGDSYSQFFAADAISYSNNSATAVMYIDAYDIVVTQILTLVQSGNASYADTVHIEYRVMNNGSSKQSVGVRIMLDTMLASNDSAPFKIAGTGNVTSCKTYTGSSIPQSYQVYDNLDNPTTLATGYLIRSGERRPDKVQFCNWRGIRSSGWNHSPADGSTLGDSAVGIYFNKTDVAPKTSMSVSTYYGVSVGSSISGGGTGGVSVTGSQFQFRVCDSATGLPVPGVTVRMLKDLLPVEATTDENGIVTFDLPDSNGLLQPGGESIRFELAKSGYKSQTYTRKVSGGMAVTLYIAKDGVPVVTSAFLGTTDLLSETVHFIEDSNDKIARGAADKKGEAKIVVTSDIQNCVFYFMENEKVLEKNMTGVFKLKTLETASGTLIEKLKSQSDRYIKCVSPDGVSSKALRLGIKVSIPSVKTSGLSDGGLEGLWNQLTLKELWPSGKARIAEGTLAALFLGDSFEFGPSKKNEALKLKVEVTENATVKVSLNMTHMPKDKVEAGKLFKEESKEVFQQSMKDYGIKTSSVSMGGFTPSFSIYGYGEGQIENGHVRIDLLIGMVGAIEGKYTNNFFWGVPLYITVGGKFSISAEAKANLLNSEGLNFHFYSGEIHPAFSVWLEGGLGTKGIANLGVEGRATIDAVINLVSFSVYVSLTGQASLKAAVWKFEKTLPFAKKTIKIYDSNDQEGTIYGGDENIWDAFDAVPYQLVSRNYLTADGTDGTEDEGLAGVYEYSNPLIVTADGTQYRFWIWDNPDLAISNSNTLVYSVLEDGSWSDPVPVLDDGTSDFYYDVAADNRYLHVVWHNSNQSFDDETVQPDDMTFAAEIWYARIDRMTGETEILRLTDDAEMDTMPAVCVLDGTAYVAWYHSANAFMENTLPNYIYYTAVTDGEMGEAVSIDCGSGFISDVSAAVIDDKPIATYRIDDSESLENTDYTAYSVDMSDGTVAAREDGGGRLITGEIDGKTVLFWYENGNIAYAPSVNDTPNYVFAEDALPDGVPEDFIVATHDGMPYVIWTANAEPDSNLKQAIAARYTGGVWNGPFVLGTLDYGNISSLSAYDDEEGNLVLSYMAVNYDVDGTLISSSMQETVIEQTRTLRVEDVDFNYEDAAPGQELPLKVYVTNTGNETIDALDLEIGSDRMEEPFRTQLQDLNLLPGTTEALDVTGFVLEEDLTSLNEGDAPYSYELGLSSEDGVQEWINFELGYVDLVFSQQKSVILDNQEHSPVLLSNRSGFDAHDVHVRVLADSENGILVYDETFETIPAYDSVCLFINTESLRGTNKLFAYYTTSSLQESDEIEYQPIYLSNETLLLIEPASLTVLAGTGGTVEDVSGDYYTEDVIELKAFPEEDYVFESWVSDQPVSFEDRFSAETTMIMPDGGAVVTANFVRMEEKDFTLSESELELQVGDSAELKAVFEDNAPARIEWSSDDPEIASVTGHGLVSALSAGETRIVARCGEFEHECLVTVTDVPIEEIHVVYPSISLSGIGATAEIETLITPEKASSPILWTTSDASVVTVSTTGLATAVGYGEADITGTAENNGQVLGVCHVTVVNTLTTISIEPGALTLDLSDPENTSAELQVIFTPEDTTDSRIIEWTNYGQEVVSIEALDENNETVRVTGNAIGEAILQAKTEGGLEAWVTVRVMCSPTGIHMNTQTSESEPLTVYVGRYVQTSASLEPSNAEGTIYWSSSNTSVASVNGGEIRGIAPGTAIITARCNDLEDYLYVSVIRDEIIVTSLEDFQSAHNYSNNMDRCWVYTFPGAAAITLTFSEDTEFESGYDYLYIMNKEEETVGSYTGTDLASQRVMVGGDTVRLRLTSDGSVTRYGFRVTDITIHYSDGWHKVDGVWYYYKDLYPHTGWLHLNSTWYYFTETGAMVAGWQKVGTTWYYFAEGGAMQTGWQKINNTWYYFSEGGAMATGWQKIGSAWYYFSEGGAMQTGWQKIGSTWYYFTEGGAMATGWQKIGDKW
ncbi:MAG: Ig-like domain-containing protein, partial [Clostridia bacterium]